MSDEELESTVKDLLTAHHIKRNSRSYTEYERAKRLLNWDDMTGANYYYAVSLIAAWVGV